MGNYSIKDLERLSGVKAHTIRIWEQRYNIIQPQRTQTNIRYYSDSDLRKLLNISLLNQQGYKISRIAKLSDKQIHSEVRKVTEAQGSPDKPFAALTLAMIGLDGQSFEYQLAAQIAKVGFEKTMTELVFPFLEHVRIMWMTEAITIAHENFVSNMVRQKLLVAIDGLLVPNAADTDGTFLLFCPDGEYHEIGLLFISYLLQSRNRKVIYLGSSIPFDDLKAVVEVHQPKHLYGYITTTPSDEELQQYIHNLSSSFPNRQIWLAGHQVMRYKFTFPANVIITHTVPQILERLEANRSIIIHTN